jgi:pilus assembly protein CpaC
MDSRPVKSWLALCAALVVAVPALALETATIDAPAAPAQNVPDIHVVTPPAGESVDLSDARRDAINLLELEFGRSATVRAASTIKRVSVGNSASLDVVVLGSREVQLVPKTTGSTNVVFWGEGSKLLGALDVAIGAPHSALERQLRKSLGVDTISVEGAGNAILLKGSVPDAVTQEHALSIARAYVSADKEDKAEEGGKNKGKENEASGAKIVNLIAVGGDHQVMLKVVIAEMNRTTSRGFGTNFAAVIDGGKINIFNTLGGLSTPDFQNSQLLVNQAVDLALTMTGFGDLEFLTVLFEALDEKGLAKVLAEPTLIARSGETASFLVGGEVPIPVTQSGSATGAITVEYKEFGVGLKFTPTVLSDDRIHLDVRPEVSEADESTGFEVEGFNLPAFRTRRASTAVELADGQSLAIAGLLLEDVTSVNQQYPILGSIPILGTFFRRTSFRKEETELMIIVTPRLVKPMGEGPHALPTDGYVEPSMFDLWMLGRLEGKPNKSTGGMVGDVGHRVSDSSYWSQN